VLCQIEEQYKRHAHEQDNEIKMLAGRLEKSQEEHLNFKITAEKRVDLLEKDLYEKDSLIRQFGAFKQQSQYNYFFPTKSTNLTRPVNSGEQNLMQSIDKHFIDEQQQKIKDILQSTIASKENALEQSKLKQIQNINALKLKLNDVEQKMSENYNTSYKFV
jgi:hypothetical protein